MKRIIKRNVKKIRKRNVINMKKTREKCEKIWKI